MSITAPRNFKVSQEDAFYFFEKILASQGLTMVSKEKSNVVEIIPAADARFSRLQISRDGDPFKEFHFHYNVGKNPGILCPKKNHGEDCPICDFASTLWGEKVWIRMKMILNVKQRSFS